jgi:exodeoxyribonuclease VII large subunit
LIKSHHHIQSFERDLLKQANAHVVRQKQVHTSLLERVRSVSQSLCERREQEVLQHTQLLKRSVSSFLKQESAAMANIAKTVANMDPQNVLKRGYSITRVNGKAISSTGQIGDSDVLETVVSDGLIYSRVDQIKKSL